MYESIWKYEINKFLPAYDWVKIVNFVLKLIHKRVKLIHINKVSLFKSIIIQKIDIVNTQPFSYKIKSVMNDVSVIKIKTPSLIKLLIFDAQPIMTSQVLLDIWELRVSSRGCFISTLITRHNLSRHLTGDVSIFLTLFFLKGSTRAGNFFFFSKMKFKTSLWAKNLTLNREVT